MYNFNDNSNPNDVSYTSNPTTDHVRQILEQPSPATDWHLPRHQRFDKDFASFDKRQREIERSRKQEYYERKRLENFKRENRIFEEMQKSQIKEDNKLAVRKEKAQNSLINAQTMGLNPITLQYYDNFKGNKLMKKENEANERAMVRAKNLELRGCSGFNIINGDINQYVNVPDDVMDKYKENIIFPRCGYRVLDDYRNLQKQYR